MGFDRAHEVSPPKVARVYKGKCGICRQDIIAGEAYDYMDGSNTSDMCIVHWNCYKVLQRIAKCKEDMVSSLYI